MDIVTAVAFAFLAGVTLAGIAASTFELAAGARLSFAPPFYHASRRPLFILAVLLAGPFMMANDALEAWRAGHIGGLELAGCGATIVAWTVAIGVAMLNGLGVVIPLIR